MRNIFFCAITGILAFVFFAPMPAAAGEAAKNVSIVDMVGKVEVMPVQTGAWVPARLNTKLGTGDMVKTEEGAHVDLDFAGPTTGSGPSSAQAAVVRVNEKSSMKIDTYVSSESIEDRKIILDLAVGDILVKVNKVKNESQFQVRTPTSIVGVRGTMFRVKTASE